jgi:CYTH domain-containing protein
MPVQFDIRIQGMQYGGRSLMPVEIERKFLVTGDTWRHGKGIRLCQGYLNREKERTVRVRLAGERAYLTVKGPTNNVTRAEYEYEIPFEHAVEMLRLCDGRIIEKNRYTVNYSGLRWEIDEFCGENRGLILAEVELQSPDQVFEHPHWLGQEVTHDPRYFNSNLSTFPYSTWTDR